MTPAALIALNEAFVSKNGPFPVSAVCRFSPVTYLLHRKPRSYTLRRSLAFRSMLLALKRVISAASDHRFGCYSGVS